MESGPEVVVYPHHVIVRCQEPLKALKNKIHLYFQSKSKSDGGECEIRDIDPSHGEELIVCFKDKEAQLGVLQKSHLLTLADKTLELSLSPVDEEDARKAEKAADARKAGNYFSSLQEVRGEEAARASDDAGHHQEISVNPDRKRESPSGSDPGNSADDTKRPRDETTGEGKWDDGRSDRRSSDGKVEAPNSPKTLDEDNGNPAESAARGNLMRRQMSREEPKEDCSIVPSEIFTEVTARLDYGKFSKETIKEIKAQLPWLQIVETQHFVEISGTFDEIKAVHQYLQKNMDDDIKAVRQYFQKDVDVAAESPRVALSEAIPPADGPAAQVCLPSALYQYIMEVYKDEMDNLERRYKVMTDHQSEAEGSSYVRFIPRGSESSPEKAKERFTDRVQEVMSDWSQENVDPSTSHRTFSEIKRLVTSRWSKILVIKEGSRDIILRGPKEELSRAKKVLEEGDHKATEMSQARKALEKGDHKAVPPRTRRVVTISSDITTELPVDARHLDLLKKLKSKEISAIEEKFSVKMEERRKNGHVLLTFRTLNAPLDLSSHASHSFVTLLQKTFYNLEKKVIKVKPDIKEDGVNVVQEQLMMGGIDVVMEYDKGSVLLIGHPVHVAFAEEVLNGGQHLGQAEAAAAGEPMDTMDTSDTSTRTKKEEEEPDKCPICLNEIQDKVTLKCKHSYCKDCHEKSMSYKPACAICGAVYGAIRGNQPEGTMTDSTRAFLSLPGYPGCGTIEIRYDFPDGIQQENHPHPGKRFSGTSRTAYLPDNPEGRDILRLLKKAFDQRLTFTVGESRTTGATDTVIWNDISHKTKMTGGPQNFGYPDPDYLKRVRNELKAKGIE